MRFLKCDGTGEICLAEDFPDDDGLPQYAILSHTWGAEEVSFKDLEDGTGKNKLGYNKIQFCGDRAWHDGLQYFWVDTCCIDKGSSTELQTALNCMFRWYRNANKCYVYLTDVSRFASDSGNTTSTLAWESVLQKSRWFTRGWTLQELIAPASVEFFSKERVYLGNKSSLEKHIHDVTGIPVQALRGSPLSDFSVLERMEWIDNRETTRGENKAYSLFGIFDVQMPLLYGEGPEKAFKRLWEEICKAANGGLLPMPTPNGAVLSNSRGGATHFTEATFNAPLYFGQHPFSGQAGRPHKRHFSLCGDGESAEPPSKTQRLSSPSKEQRLILLDSLRFDRIGVRQMTIKKAHARTCKWLLEKPEYVDWLDLSKLREHHGFLWVKGKPGAGKSTLMKFALTDARKKMKDKIIISFFFNARGDDLEKSTVGMYRSLLLQLLEQLPELPVDFESVGFSTWDDGPRQWDIEPLKALFEQSVLGLGESSLACFIDALDECDERQIRDMISYFENVSEQTTSAGVAFHVCFSSRHYPHITISTGLTLFLEGQEGHSQDIVNYLEAELKIEPGKPTDQIRVDLKEKASGIFMWVVLVVDILNKEHDEGRDARHLQKRLRDIPSDLHKLFRDILTRDCRNRDELLLCIQWLLFTREPLKPEQLYYAILSGTKPEDLSKWDPDVMSIDAVKRFILNSSKGLAEITKSKIPSVQFIHESVKDFLLKENGLQEIWSDLGSNFRGESHDRLKQCCFDYMRIATADLNVGNSLPAASSQQAADLRQSADIAFPFLEYATRNILYHADAAEGDGVGQTKFVQSFRPAEWIKLDNLFEIHERRRHKNPSLLYILAEHNLANLIRRHPTNLSCFEVEHERYGPPIFAALATGSREAVVALLQAKAEAEPLTSPLRDLCRQYSQDENKPANIRRDFMFSQRKGILTHIAEQSNEVIFAFFLASGELTTDSNDNHGRTPLSRAAEYGNKAVVELLLEKGASIEAVDRRGWTPLSWAAKNGHTAVIELLLEMGANTEAAGNSGQTPLCLAAQYGHKAVAELLLTKGANIEAADKAGRTPLSWAATNQNWDTDVMALLLEKGANIEAADKEGWTPLWWASNESREAAVELLLGEGADIEAVDKNGWTQLLWAAATGHQNVAELLIGKGANIEAVHGGWTPLWWAVGNGHEAVVEVLLGKEADIGAEGIDDWTPLW